MRIRKLTVIGHEHRPRLGKAIDTPKGVAFELQGAIYRTETVKYQYLNEDGNWLDFEIEEVEIDKAIW